MPKSSGKPCFDKCLCFTIINDCWYIVHYFYTVMLKQKSHASFRLHTKKQEKSNGFQGDSLHIITYHCTVSLIIQVAMMSVFT